MTARVEACREAAREVARLAGIVVAGVGTVITAAALVPVLVAFARVSRAEDAYFLPYGEQSRRASYLTEQLVGQRTGAELTTLGSAPEVARAAEQHLGRLLGVIAGLATTRTSGFELGSQFGGRRPVRQAVATTRPRSHLPSCPARRRP